jgi:hypothetical protein
MPPPQRKAKKGDDQPIITITVNGREYVVRPMEISAELAGRIRNACGRPFKSLIDDLDDDGEPDIDTVAGLMYVALQQSPDPRDHKTKYAALAASVTYESEIDIGDGTEDVSEDPEAPAAD